MRYTCEDSGLSDSWIEYRESWSRAESREAWKTNVRPEMTPEERQAANDRDHDELLALLRRKVTAVHLLKVDGSYLDQPADLTDDQLDQVDMRVYLWFSGTWVRCLNDLTDQGNASRRRLFATSAAVETPAEKKPETPKKPAPHVTTE